MTASAGGMTVLVCAVRGTLYAYRDACAACGSSMADGQLDREVLTCSCGSRYDVRAAGRGVADPAVHLEPLPLLSRQPGRAGGRAGGSVTVTGPAGLRRFVPGAQPAGLTAGSGRARSA